MMLELYQRAFTLLSEAYDKPGRSRRHRVVARLSPSYFDQPRAIDAEEMTADDHPVDVYREHAAVARLYPPHEEAFMVEWLAVRTAPVFLACCAMVCLEMMALGFATPLLRQRRNVWLNEEDVTRFSGTVEDVEHRDVARLVRVHRNQVENFVPFFVLGLLWIANGAAQSLGAALFVAFALSRTTHSIFYLAGMGRLRTASHTVSFLVLMILAAGVILRALAGS